MNTYVSISRPNPLILNRVRVEVVGIRGTFQGIRRSWQDAEATAARYADLFGASCQVIGRG